MFFVWLGRISIYKKKMVWYFLAARFVDYQQMRCRKNTKGND